MRRCETLVTVLLITLLFSLGALVSPAMAIQVQSTFTNQSGDGSWSNPANWDHDQKGLETFPKNGNEGNTYKVFLPMTANLDTDVTIDALVFQTLGAVTGSSTLTVVGKTDVGSSVVEFTGSGTLEAQGDINATSSLDIDGWTVNASSIVVGSLFSNGGVTLRGNATLNIGRLLDFLRDGSVRSLNGPVPLMRLAAGASIVKSSAASTSGTSDINVVIEAGNTTIRVDVGTLRFAGTATTYEFGNVTANVATDASLVISGAGSMDNLAIGGVAGTLDLSNADVFFSGGAISGDFTGVAKATGNSNLSFVTMSSQRFVLDGGELSDATIERALEWRSGRLKNVTVIRGVIAPGLYTASGIERVADGLTNNGGTSILHTVKVDDGGIRSNGLFTLYNSANLVPFDKTPGTLTDTNGLFKEGPGRSTISVSTSAVWLGVDTQGELVFEEGKLQQFDPTTGTLRNITIRISAGAVLTIRTSPLLPTLQIIGDGASVELDEGGTISGIDKLTANDGGEIKLKCAVDFDVSGNVDGGRWQDMGKEELGDGECILGPGPPPTFVCRLYELYGSLTIFNFASLTATTQADLISGELNGHEGIINTPFMLNLGATVAPGMPPEIDSDTTGCLTINGAYDQQPLATLAVELGSPLSGDFDELLILNHASLGGTLDVSFVDDHQPARGSEYVILQAASVSGTFDQIISPREDMSVVIDETSVRLRFSGRPVGRGSGTLVSPNSVQTIDQ